MLLAILGASGHGKVVADTAIAAGWKNVVFFDDGWPSVSKNGTWAVVGGTLELMSRLDEFDGVIVGIGNCEVREAKHQLLKSANVRIATIIHPRAWVSPHAQLGDGCVVMAGAVVNIDARLGDAVIVNTGSSVDHDCVLGNAVHIGPGAHLSGNVQIADRSWVGVGATVRQGLVIGTDVMVGAGAVVLKQVPSGATVVGNPARPLQRA